VAADTVVAGKAASEEATDEFANNGSGRAFGQGWIRTSEGVKPADLQSAPFGHFGTYPPFASDSYRLAPHSLQLAAASSLKSDARRIAVQKPSGEIYVVFGWFASCEP
jgi:hypothetical protein